MQFLPFDQSQSRHQRISKMKKKELKNALIRITTMYLDKSDKADQYFKECSEIDCENIMLQKEADSLRRRIEEASIAHGLKPNG